MKTLEPGMMVTSNVRLEQPLGGGGMGRVWIAEHLGLKSRVVVKFMTEELTKSGEGRVRFEREAAAAARVRSPHVVQTFDHGVMDDGVPYIVMELLEGRDLEDLLAAEGAQPLPFVRDMVQQLCRALEKAHQAGIIHRDVKPSNVFLCDAGSGELFVKLLDFGIAKGATGNTLSEATQTGLLMGSPLYMSPEQIVGAKNVDHRSDIWAVGVLAYQVITGRRPFEAETIGGLALKITNEPLPLPSTVVPHVPSEVDAWFARACARDPAERFGSAKELSDALVFALSGELSSNVMLPGGGRISTAQPSTPAAVSHTLSNSDTVAADTMSPRPRRRVFAAGAIVLALGILAGIGSRVYSTQAGPAMPPPAPSAKETPPPPTLPDTLALPPALASSVPPAALSTPPGSATPSASVNPTTPGNAKVVRPVASAVQSASASATTVPSSVVPPAKTNAVDPIF